MSEWLDMIRDAVRRVKAIFADPGAAEEIIPRASGLLNDALINLEDAEGAQAHKEDNEQYDG